MKLEYEAISNVGLHRTGNEDMALVMGQTLRDDRDCFSFELNEKVHLAAIVADGLGGHEAGEVASKMACESFRDFVETLPEALGENELILRVKDWVRTANASILAAAEGNGMGCTFTGLLLYEGKALVLNIGDSRTYRYRYETLKPLTTDHSERLRTGDMSIPSSTIYNCLGLEGAFIDVSLTRIVVGDEFVVCSDGLSDLVSDEALCGLLAHGASAQQLVDAALSAGGWDNVTVILLKFT